MSLSQSFARKSLSCFSKVCMVPRFYSKNILRRKPIRILNVPTEQTSLSINENISKSQLTKHLDNEVIESSTKTEVVVPQYEKLQTNDVRFTYVLSLKFYFYLLYMIQLI